MNRCPIQRRVRRWLRFWAVAGVALVRGATGAADYVILGGMLVDEDIEAPYLGGSRGERVISLAQEIVERQAVAGSLTAEIVVPPADQRRALQQLQEVDALLAANDLPRAFLAARDGLALDPQSLPLLQRAIVASIRLEKFDSADTYLARYLRQRPQDLPNIAAHAGVLLRLARIEEAEALIERGMSLNPEFAPLRIRRAMLRMIQGRNPGDADYWRRRSLEDWQIVLAWLVDEREPLERIFGEDDYRRLCETVVGADAVPKLAEWRNRVDQAARHRAKRRYAEARAEIEALLRDGFDVFGVRAALADLLMLEGMTSESIRRWEQLVGEYSDFAQAWLSYGFVLLRARRAADALAPLRKALDIVPGEPVVRFTYACALGLSGKGKEAQDIFDELIRANRHQFRFWMEFDPVLEEGVRSVPNAPNYLRAMEIPPEIE